MQFKEWNTNQKGTGKSYKDKASISNLTTKNGATIKLYAQWQLIQYEITYELPKEVENSDKNPSSYTRTDTIKLANPNKMTGYSFQGWYTARVGGTKVTSIKKGTTGNMKLYARYVPINYTVQFDGNDVISDVPEKQTCVYDQTYTLPAVSGNSNLRWNTRADGTGITYKSGQSFSNLTSANNKNIILYAMKQYEEAWFPALVMDLEQIPYEKWSGVGTNTNASHYKYNAIDILPHGDVIAPFTGSIVYKDEKWGYVLFVSDDPVIWADGSIVEMSVAFMHDSNIEDLYEGQHIEQGTPFYQAGGMGNGNPTAYGSHVDISVFKGAKTKEWIKTQPYYGNGDTYAFDAFFINSKITTIGNSYQSMGKVQDGNYLTVPGAPSDWSKLWRYLN